MMRKAFKASFLQSSVNYRQNFSFPFCKPLVLNLTLRFGEEPGVKGQVLEAGDLQGQEFSGMEEVPQVSPRVFPAGWQRQAFVNGPEIAFPFGVSHVQNAFRRV